MLTVWDSCTERYDRSGTIMCSTAYPFESRDDCRLCLLFFSTFTDEDGRWIGEMNSDGVSSWQSIPRLTVHSSGQMSVSGEWVWEYLYLKIGRV